MYTVADHCRFIWWLVVILIFVVDLLAIGLVDGYADEWFTLVDEQDLDHALKETPN